MGKYRSNYGYGYGDYGYGGGRGSVSGWEKSHFGGFNRVLTDYPYIKTDFNLDIKSDDSIRQDLGTWIGDKLIKLYVLKAKELGLVKNLTVREVKRKSFLGTEKRYSVINLGHTGVFAKVCNENSEMAPMFEHYKEGILKSSLEMELYEEPEGDGGKGEKGEKGESEKSEKKKGEGSGEGDEEGEDGEGEGEAEGSGSPAEGKPQGVNRNGQTIGDLINDMNESKPITSDSLSKFDQPTKFVSFASRIRTAPPSPYRFSSSEIKDSEALLKLLDISFDPKNDVIKNLKLGKLDCSKIAEVPAGNISVYKQEVEDQDTKPFSVCVLADMSGSMHNGTRVGSQLHIMNMLYLAMSQILPPDKLYIYGHSGYTSPEIYTFYTPYDRDYEKNIKYYHGVNWAQNYDGPVIEEIHKKIRETNDDRIIFISLSDGMPAGCGYGGKHHNEELKRILEKARRDSFVTVGIGIQADHVNQLYTYAKPVWDLKTLPKDVAGIVNQVVRSEFK